MGISTKGHKKSKTGAQYVKNQKKRKNCIGRQPSNTKIGKTDKIKDVRVRGGNIKKRALRLFSGNFRLVSDNFTEKAKILSVLYNPSSNELMRTNILTKSSVVKIDAIPFSEKITSNPIYETDKEFTNIFNENKALYGIITSRPGQCGAANGHILQGKELKFYLTLLKQKNKKKVAI